MKVVGENETQPSSVMESKGIRKIIAAGRIRRSPFPPPEEFAKYKEIMPDLPERIVKQFEEDSLTNRELAKESQAADIELQKTAQLADINFETRSQWMAFIVILLGLTSTFVLAYFDKDVAAVATGISTVLLIFKGVFNKDKTSDKAKEE